MTNFVLRKTPEEWAAEDGIRILDPDGWRLPQAPSFDEPLTYIEYKERMMRSTVQVLRVHP